MDSVIHETNKDRSFSSPSQQDPYFIYQTPPSPVSYSHSNAFNLTDKVSPSILLIIVIVAVVFFISGLLRLLMRFLMRPPNRHPDDFESVTELQGQLQQLFHLHDAGVDQSFIDTLPVFHYKAIIGLKHPFDCAVCLCEFEQEDKLRLLPKCSHAFHMECIDRWLLSHSTCPVCRANLLPDFSTSNGCSPVVFILESGSESSREIVAPYREGIRRTNSLLVANSWQGQVAETEAGSNSSSIVLSCEFGEYSGNNESTQKVVVNSGERVVTVKLGKYRNVDGCEGSSSTNSNVDGRRCFSMGSFAYVMDENSTLQVPIRTPMKKKLSAKNKKPSLPITSSHQPAMSECDCESRTEFVGFEGIKCLERSKNGVISTSADNGKDVTQSKRESFSISKTWLRGNRQKPNSTMTSSRRAFSFSFRFPANENVISGYEVKEEDEIDLERSSLEFGVEMRGNQISEVGSDVENRSGKNYDTQPSSDGGGPSCGLGVAGQSYSSGPSFSRRTLLWFVGSGRQNKVVHSSSSPDF